VRERSAVQRGSGMRRRLVRLRRSLLSSGLLPGRDVQHADHDFQLRGERSLLPRVRFREVRLVHGRDVHLRQRAALRGGPGVRRRRVHLHSDLLRGGVLSRERVRSRVQPRVRNRRGSVPRVRGRGRWLFGKRCLHLRLRGGVHDRADVHPGRVRVQRHLLPPRVLLGQHVRARHRQCDVRRRGFGVRHLPIESELRGRRRLQRLHGRQLPQRLLLRSDLRDFGVRELRGRGRGLFRMRRGQCRQLLRRGSVQLRIVGALRTGASLFAGQMHLQLDFVPGRVLQRHDVHDVGVCQLRNRWDRLCLLQLERSRQLLALRRLQLRGRTRLRRWPDVLRWCLRLQLDVVRRMLHRQRVLVTGDRWRMRSRRLDLPILRPDGRRVLFGRRMHMRRRAALFDGSALLGRQLRMRRKELQRVLQWSDL